MNEDGVPVTLTDGNHGNTIQELGTGEVLEFGDMVIHQSTTYGGLWMGTASSVAGTFLDKIGMNGALTCGDAVSSVGTCGVGFVKGDHEALAGMPLDPSGEYLFIQAYVGPAFQFLGGLNLGLNHDAGVTIAIDPMSATTYINGDALTYPLAPVSPPVALDELGLGISPYYGLRWAPDNNWHNDDFIKETEGNYYIKADVGLDIDSILELFGVPTFERWSLGTISFNGDMIVDMEPNAEGQETGKLRSLSTNANLDLYVNVLDEVASFHVPMTRTSMTVRPGEYTAISGKVDPGDLDILGFAIFGGEGNAAFHAEIGGSWKLDFEISGSIYNVKLTGEVHMGSNGVTMDVLVDLGATSFRASSLLDLLDGSFKLEASDTFSTTFGYSSFKVKLQGEAGVTLTEKSLSTNGDIKGCFKFDSSQLISGISYSDGKWYCDTLSGGDVSIGIVDGRLRACGSIKVPGKSTKNKCTNVL